MATKCEQSRKKKERLRRQHEEYLGQVAVKREFQAALLRVLDVLELTDLYRQLPLTVQNRFVYIRTRSVRLMLGEGARPSRRVLEQMRSSLSMILKKEKAPPLLGYRKVILEDLFTAGMTLFFYGASEPGLKCSQKEMAFREKLKPFVEKFIQVDSPAVLALNDSLSSIAITFSRVNQSMYDFVLDLYTESVGLAIKTSCSAVLRQIKAVTKNFIIQGKSRPAYKVGGIFPRIGFKWASVSYDKLGIDSQFGALPIDVYIQSHALIRIRERLDSIYHAQLDLILYHSLLFLKKAVTYNSNKLIPARIRENKVGYFLVEIVDGIALIKTFLFMTNTGTPEGDKLDEELNAGKIEKEFLKLDLLSTYTNSDLPEDPRIRAIFEKVGLGYLCALDREIFSNSRTVKKGYALDFIKYMNVDRKDW
ncbi:MAG TPA: hypothetical protein VHO70_12060 [Chitinispirillaceae bacterium]|nr:hypothetical protein [Chitinispirillaceae bacterium]